MTYTWWVLTVDSIDVLPPNNLPDRSVDWGRALTDEVVALRRALTTVEQSLLGENRTNAANIANVADQIQQLQINYPVGAVILYSAPTPPVGWLLCNGSAVSRTDYADLFSTIGTLYGEGDGVTTFNLPNLSGRVPAGWDPSQSEFDSVGKLGGEKDHQLTINEMPSHTHIQDAHSHTQASHSHTVNSHTHSYTVPDTVFSAGTGGLAGALRNASGGSSATSGSSSPGTNSATPAINSTTATNQDTGGGLPHNNLQPYITLPYIIKYVLM
jgi:microcystin-dependent protein